MGDGEKCRLAKLAHFSQNGAFKERLRVSCGCHFAVSSCLLGDVKWPQVKKLSPIATKTMRTHLLTEGVEPFNCNNIS